MDASPEEFAAALQTITTHILARQAALPTLPVLPTPAAYAHTISSLPARLPHAGEGTTRTSAYLLDTLLPGCLQAQNGPNYFGFVVGGVTPAAQIAEILTGQYDENVSTAMPGVSAASVVEAKALEMVLDLVGVERDAFQGRTITTGATASNVLGLACARDYLYAHSPHLAPSYSFAQSGPPSSPTLPSPPIIILSLHPHFSILKASALVGLGSGPDIVQTVPHLPGDELAFDLEALRARLKKEKAVGRGVVVVYGMGEVNTGGFGGDLVSVGEVCEEFGAWLHVDGAFGGFAAVLPEYREATKGLEKAHSLTLDGHKWLNVPYDCGLFFSRHVSHLTSVFAPPSASTPAYLSSSAGGGTASASATRRPEGEIDPTSVTTPMYLGIENSRRFRALPLFASLMSLGKQGYEDLIRRNILLARRIAAYLDESPSYELLNHSSPSLPLSPLPIIPLNIVLFRGSATSRFATSAQLLQAINGTGRTFVTGTAWRGEGAVRLAVSNWMSGGGGEEEWQRIEAVFEEAARGEGEEGA